MVVARLGRPALAGLEHLRPGGVGVLHDAKAIVVGVEFLGSGGLRDELCRLLPAGLVGPVTLGVFAAQGAGLLVGEGAGASGRFQEVGEGHRGLRGSFSVLVDFR